MPVLILTLVFLGLNGLLWYERPAPGVWLAGSVLLGGGWGALFLRLISARDGR